MAKTTNVTFTSLLSNLLPLNAGIKLSSLLLFKLWVVIFPDVWTLISSILVTPVKSDKFIFEVSVNTLDNLTELGIAEIGIVVGHMAEYIKSNIGTNWKYYRLWCRLYINIYSYNANIFCEFFCNRAKI